MIQSIRNSVTNYKGWKTNRKIVVFESDDWGSIRMPDRTAFEYLKAAGINVEKSAYCRYDSIESNDDLEKLFEIIIKYKDFKGNHPCITANTVVANPDFEKIEQSDFTSYFFEPFSNTLSRLPNRSNVLNLYNVGIQNKLFYPQFHGREHLQVELWLELLKTNPNFRIAFQNKLWGLSLDVFPNMKKSVQASYDTFDNDFLFKSLTSGLNLFESLFGYRSQSFIANNFIWGNSINHILKDNGVEFIQGMKYQLLPKRLDEVRKKVFHFTGEMNELGQYFLVRNCSFEPSIEGLNIPKTLGAISNAFFWGKPAIISTHRINFIGSLDESNRNINLRGFENLLKSILKKWPQVEFMTSVELGHLIKV
jgi:hypothetical protein